MIKKRILVIDDEDSIRNVVRDMLETDGYAVIEGKNSEEAIRKARDLNPDLIVLDLGIPTIGGLEVCRILRKDEDTSEIPIIMLTVRDREVDKVIGLEMGADDYVTKPFNRRELVARIRAVLRRMNLSESQKQILKAGDVQLDTEAHMVKVKEEPVELRPKEFDILELLLLKRGNVLSREFLCESVLGYEFFGSSRTIDAHVKNLRKSLGDSGDIIKTVRGLGYKIEE